MEVMVIARNQSLCIAQRTLGQSRTEWLPSQAIQGAFTLSGVLAISLSATTIQ